MFKNIAAQLRKSSVILFELGEILFGRELAVNFVNLIKLRFYLLRSVIAVIPKRKSVNTSDNFVQNFVLKGRVKSVLVIQVNPSFNGL